MPGTYYIDPVIREPGDNVTPPPPPPPDTFDLTVTVGTGGTVTGGNATWPGTTSYDENEEVTLTATPDSGYTFAGWGGVGNGSTSTTLVVTMDASKQVTATFDAPAPPANYTLTVNVAQGGTVTSSPAGINAPTDPQEVYEEDTVVTLTAVADTDQALYPNTNVYPSTTIYPHG